MYVILSEGVAYGPWYTLEAAELNLLRFPEGAKLQLLTLI